VPNSLNQQSNTYSCMHTNANIKEFCRVPIYLYQISNHTEYKSNDKQFPNYDRNYSNLKDLMDSAKTIYLEFYFTNY